MKGLMSFILVLALALFFGFQTQNVFAQQKGKISEKGFIDANADDINDNAKDDDGDGIPNCKDEDYVKTEDGNGSKSGSRGKNCNRSSGCQKINSEGK